MATSHVSKVRSLYKRILVLHRFLPIDLRALGDQYVKDEFRRHKGASAEEAERFTSEWEVKHYTLPFQAVPRVFNSPPPVPHNTFTNTCLSANTILNSDKMFLESVHSKENRVNF